MTNLHLKTGVDSTPETCEKHFRQWIPSNKFMLLVIPSLDMIGTFFLDELPIKLCQCIILIQFYIRIRTRALVL